jgi:hypothetical protein
MKKESHSSRSRRLAPAFLLAVVLVLASLAGANAASSAGERDHAKSPRAHEAKAEKAHHSGDHADKLKQAKPEATDRAKGAASVAARADKEAEKACRENVKLLMAEERALHHQNAAEERERHHLAEQMERLRHHEAMTAAETAEDRTAEQELHHANAAAERDLYHANKEAEKARHRQVTEDLKAQKKACKGAEATAEEETPESPEGQSER